MSNTVANVKRSESSHWYTKTGEACYEVPNKSNGGMRPTTLADARKLDLLPSVTTILNVLRKPGLERWLIEQSVLAVCTAPTMPGEALDAKIDRVLNQERQQDEEAAKARELGTRIHDGIEKYLNIGVCDDDLVPFVAPACAKLLEVGACLLWTERVLVGNGYAGKADAAVEGMELITVVDFKSVRSALPKNSYIEHKVQLSGYAKAFGNTGDKRLQTANLYISTSNPGEVALCVHNDWQETFEKGFAPLLTYWQWANRI